MLADNTLALVVACFCSVMATHSYFYGSVRSDLLKSIFVSGPGGFAGMPCDSISVFFCLGRAVHDLKDAIGLSGCTCRCPWCIKWSGFVLCFFFLGMDLNTQFVICIIFCSDFLVFIFPTSLISLINFACHFTLFSLYIGFIRFIRFFRFASRTYVFIIWIYFFKVIIIILRTCIHIIVWISVCS